VRTLHCSLLRPLRRDCITKHELQLCVRFEAKVGETVIRTETKRKANAEAEFASAVAQGHTAVILKQQVTWIRHRELVHQY
jgi:Vault protein inter-alpha-trypsin domain